MQFDIVRAWKDEQYRQSLSEEQLSQLPANPAGELELSDGDLAAISAGGLGSGGVVVHHHLLSVALICEINIYTISILGNIALLGSITQICSKI